MTRKEELEAYQKNLVQYLKQRFCSPYKVEGEEVSRNVYAEKSEVSGATLTRINAGYAYDVPISTIYKICKFENVTITKFFSDFEGSLIDR